MTDDLRAAPEFQAYLRARDAVLQMKARRDQRRETTDESREPRAESREPKAERQEPSAESRETDPSAYWAAELENIDYLIDASPLIVRKLRHHAFHITGIRPYDYREKGDGRREQFESRLRALRELGSEALLVPESPALGGFGYEIDGRLFNVDTLKFFEVLAGMQRGGVLDAVRAAARPVVCEIGAGWGGFAYQFKTLVPGAAYVIVDFPELFLFSATYLATLFPEARMLFCGTEASPALDGWRDADFVFVPHTMAPLVSGLPLDLTLNMVSFQEMTDAQVREYAGIAARAGCPLLYSLNRERSPYNTQLVSVSEALAGCYRLTEVPVLGSDYTSAMKKRARPGRMAERSELAYRHLVGRLSLGGRESAVGGRESAVGDRRSAVGGRESAVGDRPSAVGGRESAVGNSSSAAAGDRQSAVGFGGGAPRVLLGMTLYNNARHLREAMESLLGQTFGDFRLYLLDDASSDGTESIARAYEAKDPRVTFARHAARRAMIATWREVAELAMAASPAAPYFAWVSDHDRWHPRWLERMVAELDADPGVVLAYPITRRMTQDGHELDKGPRLFDTAALTGLRDRWRHFCAEGVGAGDMVYGLMRVEALRRAGVFRTVLRPDRLLVAELTLYGRIRQVPEVLWYRRQSSGTSVERQRHTLVLPGEEPRWFSAPPWLQHTLSLWRDYAAQDPPPLPLDRAAWRRMLLQYQLTYGWRHFRKSDTSHGINAAINRAVWARKQVRHHYHHAVYNTLVGARALWGRTRRTARRAVYEALVFTHRAGLRGATKARSHPRHEGTKAGHEGTKPPAPRRHEGGPRRHEGMKVGHEGTKIRGPRRHEDMGATKTRWDESPAGRESCPPPRLSCLRAFVAPWLRVFVSSWPRVFVPSWPRGFVSSCLRGPVASYLRVFVAPCLRAFVARHEPMRNER